MKKLMIPYMYTFALFYNTAHLMHDIEKLPGVQQFIFLVICMLMIFLYLIRTLAGRIVAPKNGIRPLVD